VEILVGNISFCCKRVLKEIFSDAKMGVTKSFRSKTAMKFLGKKFK
jgi:hypothetical protein